MQTSEERLMDLEYKLSYLEQSLEQLDKQLMAQYQRIRELEQANQALKQWLRKLSDEDEDNAPPMSLQEEKPPHY